MMNFTIEMAIIQNLLPWSRNSWEQTILGWFNEQIKSRIKNDEDQFSEAFKELSTVILGKKSHKKNFDNIHKRTKNALEEILNFYHVKLEEFPENIEDMNKQLEYALRPAGIMRRRVQLTGHWYKDASGPMLGITKNGDPVALIPGGSSYYFYDYTQKQKIYVNKNTCSFLEQDAFCFYKLMPLHPLEVKDLLKYIIQLLSTSDLILMLSLALSVTILGMMVPFINQIIFSKVIPMGETIILIPLTCLLMGIVISKTLIMITQSLITSKIQMKMNIAVQSATMARVFSLPASFFKDYSSGELSNRCECVNSLCNMLIEVILSTGLSAIFSLIYIIQILKLAPNLAVVSIIITGINLLVTVLAVVSQLKNTRKRLDISAKLSGLIYSLLLGIEKIKLSGSERRVFVKWAESYKELAKLNFNQSLFLKINPQIIVAINTFGAIAIYYFATLSNVSVANYVAFSVAYGMLSASIAMFSNVAKTIANIKPVLEMSLPILKATPEINANKKIVSRISGMIELNNISFSYENEQKKILNNLTIKIKAGQYIAIVGRTGCGKSTLIRILLGFETPQKGSVYYDGKDIKKLDIKSIRQQIGTIMQNGKIFQGDIFINIIISAPWLTQEDAWEAAEFAGFADDIRSMPMGMHTLIDDGFGLAGGQKQRLMIARAIAAKPRILILDEATSALDNITQKKISNSIDALKCTRIVIAHRLSTIKQCDRIIVLDNGVIVEDGTYEQLISKEGFFNELVERQLLKKQEM